MSSKTKSFKNNYNLNNNNNNINNNINNISNISNNNNIIVTTTTTTTTSNIGCNRCILCRRGCPKILTKEYIPELKDFLRTIIYILAKKQKKEYDKLHADDSDDEDDEEENEKQYQFVQTKDINTFIITHKKLLNFNDGIVMDKDSITNCLSHKHKIFKSGKIKYGIGYWALVDPYDSPWDQKQQQANQVSKSRGNTGPICGAITHRGNICQKTSICPFHSSSIVNNKSNTNINNSNNHNHIHNANNINMNSYNNNSNSNNNHLHGNKVTVSTGGSIDIVPSNCLCLLCKRGTPVKLKETPELKDYLKIIIYVLSNNKDTNNEEEDRYVQTIDIHNFISSHKILLNLNQNLIPDRNSITNCLSHQHRIFKSGKEVYGFGYWCLRDPKEDPWNDCSIDFTQQILQQQQLSSSSSSPTQSTSQLILLQQQPLIIKKQGPICGAITNRGNICKKPLNKCLFHTNKPNLKNINNPNFNNNNYSLLIEQHQKQLQQQLQTPTSQSSHHRNIQFLDKEKDDDNHSFDESDSDEDENINNSNNSNNSDDFNSSSSSSGSNLYQGKREYIEEINDNCDFLPKIKRLNSNESLNNFSNNTTIYIGIQDDFNQNNFFDKPPSQPSSPLSNNISNNNCTSTSTSTLVSTCNNYSSHSYNNNNNVNSVNNSQQLNNSVVNNSISLVSLAATMSQEKISNSMFLSIPDCKLTNIIHALELEKKVLNNYSFYSIINRLQDTIGESLHVRLSREYTRYMIIKAAENDIDQLVPSPLIDIFHRTHYQDSLRYKDFCKMIQFDVNINMSSSSSIGSLISLCSSSSSTSDLLEPYNINIPREQQKMNYKKFLELYKKYFHNNINHNTNNLIDTEIWVLELQ
ncbi:hypothetical protein DICPUDRAFT_99781 [Dictyostelium purpureum]|uniref:Uncharacterized protein n=1 Tax=Dictyostelium purpureum TaxID=5786 RepID=F1A2G9_DICPU|nr:uncharacterized protein DICPUDRAFT_99781 [Dictyostelium purpureum]EGC29610.1 hypothetical protein DICPUDRAFT_99781 [Dictyostelium purpureum]|eukprot:XP_003293861.1 hypothetical protein DICPUDRAFT_99781 [Dictyostelium purpureum]